MIPMIQWLRPLATKVRKNWVILDGLAAEFYICFDCSVDPETSEAQETCDIWLTPVGRRPNEGIRVTPNADLVTIIRFLAGLGLHRLPQRIQQTLVKKNSRIALLYWPGIQVPSE